MDRVHVLRECRNSSVVTSGGYLGEFPAELVASRKTSVRSADLLRIAYYFLVLRHFVVLPVRESERVAKA